MNWIVFDLTYGKYLLCMTDCRMLFELDPRVIIKSILNYFAIRKN